MPTVSNEQIIVAVPMEKLNTVAETRLGRPSGYSPLATRTAGTLRHFDAAGAQLCLPYRMSRALLRC